MPLIVASRPEGVLPSEEFGGNPIGTNRLQMSNEELSRRMPFGDKWNEIRIGIRFAFWGGQLEAGQFSTFYNSSANFTLGVSDEGCGLRGDNYDGDTWHLGIGGSPWTCAGTPAYFSTTNFWYMWWIRQGVATATSTAFSTPYFSADPRYTRSAMYIHLQKYAATQYRGFICMANSAAQAQVDWSRASFMPGMWTYGTPTNTTATTAATPTSTGTTGTMDYAQVSWTRNVPVLEIWDFAVTRFG